MEVLSRMFRRMEHVGLIKAFRAGNGDVDPLSLLLFLLVMEMLKRWRMLALLRILQPVMEILMFYVFLTYYMRMIQSCSMMLVPKKFSTFSC